MDGGIQYWMLQSKFVVSVLVSIVFSLTTVIINWIITNLPGTEIDPHVMSGILAVV